MGDESVPELVGGRPEVLAEPRPQERALRHSVEHIVDSYVLPFVQIVAFDVPVPQRVDQLMDAIRSKDSPMAEQVIAVPSRRWRNSWLKCRRSCPMLCSSSGMRSKPSTLQFPVVVVVRVVYKVLTQDRVQQCRLWSRSSTSQFVEAFLVFSQDRDRRCGAARGHSGSWWWPSCPSP